MNMDIGMSSAERIASLFHYAYEDLAPSFGYETRPESRRLWSELPENNRRLMVATVEKLIKHNIIRPA